MYTRELGIDLIDDRFECFTKKDSFGVSKNFIKITSISKMVKEVTVTAFHPYKTNFFWSTYYSLHEFFWEAKAIKVLVGNQQQPMYANVEEIALAFGMTKEELLKVYYHCSGSRINFSMILSLLNQYSFPQNKLKVIFSLLKRVNFQSFIHLVQYAKKYSLKHHVINVLIQAGEKPGNSCTYQDDLKAFSCFINPRKMEFKFTHEKIIEVFDIVSNKNATFFKCPSILTTNGTKSIVSINRDSNSSKIVNAVMNFFSTSKIIIPEAIENLYKMNELETNQLHTILKEVNYINIVKLANTAFKDEQKKFLQTILKASSCMQKNQGIWETLFGSRLKYEKQDHKHFGFAVNENTVIVVGRTFAEGGFKEASHAFVLNTMQKVVELKITEQKKSNSVQLTIEEKNLLDKIALNNPYLTPRYECVINDSKNGVLVMFQPYFEGRGAHLNKASPWQLCMAVYHTAMGLSLMHEDGYAHSDIKGENLFFNGPLEGNQVIETKVGDIGVAQLIGRKIRGGSFVYLPPEALFFHGNKIGFNVHALAEPTVDSWSLGVTIFECLGGSEGKNLIPLASLNEKALNAKIQKIRDKILLNPDYYEFERKLMLQLTDITEGLLTFDKKKRWRCPLVAKKLEFVSMNK